MKTVISIPRSGRVLIVEDNQERQDWFARRLLHLNVASWWADVPERALNWFEIMPPESFDAIFLDYDLGPEPVENSTINSMPIVKYLNKACPTRRQQRNIIIHSHNTVAADWMAALLPGASKIRFGDFTIEEK